MLEIADVRRLLDHVSDLRHATRNRVIIMLSFKAGLRACEIAGLTWSMVLRPNGQLAPVLFVSGDITKGGSPRRIPVHADLLAALRCHRIDQGRPRDGPVIASERGGHMTGRSIVNWFAANYAELGLDGCSSHSGRRTFITRSARMLAKTGGSLRDLQELVGHRDLATTQRYIEGNRDAQRKLIALI
ncbi:tyrosine-type recombinase/integrase [Sphingomonas sp. PB4P5]|uniref:tyrosine-type recombinase/integrase n=1 Tax=Parasphingomonas puruogangriensis TaxID=3096155 RepID=UPI002FC6437B